MANLPAQKSMDNNVLVKRKQNAARSLNNYMNQLKIHFDLSDRDIISVLELAIREKRNETFIKKWWHILK